jgi:hypothetical protein
MDQLADRFAWTRETWALQPGDRVWIAVAYHANDGDIWEIEDVVGATWYLRSVATNRRCTLLRPNEIRREQS